MLLWGSWITVCGASESPAIDTKDLQEAVTAAEALVAEDYTAGSYAEVEKALEAARAQLAAPASQEEVNAAKAALDEAVEGLVSIKDLRDYYNANKLCSL